MGMAGGDGTCAMLVQRRRRDIRLTHNAYPIALSFETLGTDAYADIGGI
jgi:hypothetical protein